MKKSSSLQWSFSNSQFLSFKSAQEQGVGANHHKPYPPGFTQRNLGLDQYPIPSHPWQPKDVISPELTIFRGTNTNTNTDPAATQIVPASCAATAASNSITPPHGPLVGSTDLKSSPSISSGLCQLTLFYNGSVCVFDNVSPEKAQAIMLLAGNGESKNSTASATTLPTPPKLQSSVLRPPENDTTGVGLSSPISLPSPIISLPAIAPSSSSASAVELNPIKPVVVNSAQIKSPEALTSAASVGANAVKTTPSAVPQARKASLTRFLEKRKERVTMTAAPYVVSKKGSENSTVGSTFSRIPVSSSPSTS